MPRSAGVTAGALDGRRTQNMCLHGSHVLPAIVGGARTRSMWCRGWVLNVRRPGTRDGLDECLRAAGYAPGSSGGLLPATSAGPASGGGLGVQAGGGDGGGVLAVNMGKSAKLLLLAGEARQGRRAAVLFVAQACFQCSPGHACVHACMTWQQTGTVRARLLAV